MTRGWVVTASGRPWGPLLMLGMGLLGPNEQDVSDGRPEPQLNETDSGNPEPVGVTVTVYVAGTPAITVAVAGEAPIRKSLTAALPDAPGNVVPPTLSVALLPTESGAWSAWVVVIGSAAICASYAGPDAGRLLITRSTPSAVGFAKPWSVRRQNTSAAPRSCCRSQAM